VVHVRIGTECLNLDKALERIEEWDQPDIPVVTAAWSDESSEELSGFLNSVSEYRVHVDVEFEDLRREHLVQAVFMYPIVRPVVRPRLPGDGCDLVVGDALRMPADPSEYERARCISLVSEKMRDFVVELRDALLAMKRGRKNPDPPWDPFDGQLSQADYNAKTRGYTLPRGKPNLRDVFLAHDQESGRQKLGNATPAETERRAKDAGWEGTSTKLLVTGDSGTGKSLVAELAHAVLYPETGDRRPFVPINCGALDSQQLEFELFGAAPGHYTGVGAPVGDLARAAYGTAFLDEFGDMPNRCRVVLLTYLDDLLLKPRGVAPFFSFSHVVAATNRDLDALIRVNEFRNDLVQRFQRRVRVPSLQERGAEEKIALVDLAAQAPNENPFDTARRCRPVKRVSAEALEMLTAHQYADGNVRELESIVHHALQKARRRYSDTIQPDDLDIPSEAHHRPDNERNIVSVKALPKLDAEVSVDDCRDLERLAERSGRPILRTAGGELGTVLDSILYRYDEQE